MLSSRCSGVSFRALQGTDSNLLKGIAPTSRFSGPQMERRRAIQTIVDCARYRRLRRKKAYTSCSYSRMFTLRCGPRERALDVVSWSTETDASTRRIRRYIVKRPLVRYGFDRRHPPYHLPAGARRFERALKYETSKMRRRLRLRYESVGGHRNSED